MEEVSDVNMTRYKKLGFKPQKEIIYNKFLPYADDLDEESVRLFTDIKTNLVKSVLAREIRPGFGLWTSRLNRYLKIYGFKFSKEDHIGLIKLYYDLLGIPNLEPTRVNKIALTLSFLLKKKYLLSRDDLELDWKPLFQLFNRITGKTLKGTSQYRYFAALENTFDVLIKATRIYFPASATKEILDKFRLKLCPHSDADMNYAVDYLEGFLPILIKREEVAIGYNLWFEEFMNLWQACSNSSNWENNMAWLMARLAFYNIGYINWEPYIPFMFAKFTRLFCLPVKFRQTQVLKICCIDMSAATLWIASSLGGPSDTAFIHLENLVHVLESYLHSANCGRWSLRIRDFIKKLSYQFVNRVHNERYKKKSWEPEIPDSHKLTDADIDRFINCLKPCVEHLVYSLHHTGITYIFNCLASLRPNIIIPILLDKLYMSMESLTEPHKLTSAMISVSAVSRYMVQGAKVNYPEGPTHVIPLLLNLLPGIDPNDIRKCYMTFNFMVQFINMMPLINSSEANQYYDDLTEEEHIICEATANFEDFVLQFFDRLCIWIESNSLESTRMEQNFHDLIKTKAENNAETALLSVTSTVLSQCSPTIFTAALRKMYKFATNRIFEIKVSGKMVSIICQSFARVNAEETAVLFIPHLCDVIETILEENEGILKEDHVSGELLYYLLLLAEVLDIRSEILKYIDRISVILDRVLFMKCVAGYDLAAHILGTIMISLTFPQPIETRSSNKPYDSHIKDFLSVRDWGEPGDLKNLNIKWFVPGEKEVVCAQMLLNRYLVPELKRLNDHSSDDIKLSREDLRKTFKIICAALASQTILPLWNEPSINLIDSVLEPWAFELNIGCPHTAKMPDGSNIRKEIANTMHKVQKKILETDESDTKSLSSVIYIYDVLLFNKFKSRDFEWHWKMFHLSKSLLKDYLHKKKMHLRSLLIDRVMLHQELRNEQRSCTFTKTHKQIMLDLFELSVCHYSQIRCFAQGKLFSAVNTFPYSYTILIPRITEILKMDSVANHEQFKGCLHVMLGPRSSPIVAKYDWHYVKDMWPALLQSIPSEKPSIINLMRHVTDSVHSFFPTIAVNLEIPDYILNRAYDLSKTFPQVDLTGFEDMISSGENRLALMTKANNENYNKLTTDILNTIKQPSLNLRHKLMGLRFLRDLVHPEVKYQTEIVNYFLNTMVCDSLKMRKFGLKAMLFVLSQNKPDFKKLEIEGPESDAVSPGLRTDNEWVLYNSKTVPSDEETWDKARFMHRHYKGYYCWPTTIEVYSPSSEQPNVYKNINTSCTQLQEIYHFMRNKDNIDLLIKYYSLEESKDEDSFEKHRFLFFKNFFKIFGYEMVEIFLPHLEVLVASKQGQHQRCAAEIISGIISGSKHWGFDELENLWKVLIPLLKTVFNNLFEEVLLDWVTAISTSLHNRDPNNYSKLLEFLMDNPLNEPSSFQACSRLYILQIAINQQIWRNVELINRNLTYFKKHLSHPFQNVREKISFCLASTFTTNLRFTNPSDLNPNISEFFMEVMPSLNKLYDTILYKAKHDHENNMESDEKIDIHQDADIEANIKLFKVLCSFAMANTVKNVGGGYPEFYSLMPLACVLQSNDDDELKLICTSLIAILGYTLVLPKNMPVIMDTIKNITECQFWCARAAIAEFVPVFVCYNMSIIISKDEWKNEVVELSVKLLKDSQPEVRVKASNILSGFLHCSFISNPMELLESFKKMAKSKSKSKQTQANNLQLKHAGVLGLCSFINAHPYDVPDYLPEIFKLLGPHLNDPQPIPATIRKTLDDFKRTHHSNWEIHKLKFTEDDLTILSDLAVPPSYYA